MKALGENRGFVSERRHAPLQLGDVLVIGLGKSGKAACRYCAGLLGGRVRSLTVYAGPATDDALAFAAGFDAQGVSFVFGSERIEGRFDLCIASPGISPFDGFYRNAQDASTELISEVEFAWRESTCASRWIAISGTNGKTTTTALAAHILASAGYTAAAVGNIGETCLDAVRMGTTEVYVAEVSSYQLASTSLFAPDVAVLLNITPDHLSWHQSHAAYVQAKRRLFANLSAPQDRQAGLRRWAIVDATNDESRGILKELRAIPDAARGFSCLPLGTKAGIEGDMRGLCGSTSAAFIDSEGMLRLALDGSESCLGPVAGLQIKGSHNAMNALAAAGAALALGASPQAVREALATFAPLEHRIEPCGSVAGADCYNDSKATNVDATLKALAAFVPLRPIVLLGGRDKGTALDDLVQGAVRYAKSVVCFGEAAERFFDAFAACGLPRYREASLEAALDKALAIACAGDVVLLSPACASFDEFESFEHRGKVFKGLVAQRARERGV
ncbi:MAG: UDP-N-acetylmuramoyl-L-alanine--D-glutamate ligase [Coriobacteriaceae bacterium]|jgi:UDP-N-acetylmuramoylalanine--D-glutamate ligase|nr:UDP-N-acetylmuramoyl-L-alanine--D-glutamate ligase [Coriobacteriaceae bacterium]